MTIWNRRSRAASFSTYFRFRQRLRVGQHALDMVEQVVEHRVFRPQYIGDFHGAKLVHLPARRKSKADEQQQTNGMENLPVAESIKKVESREKKRLKAG